MGEAGGHLRAHKQPHRNGAGCELANKPLLPRRHTKTTGLDHLRAGHRAALALGSRRMVSLPKPEIILTHESDLDGLLSGVWLQRLARKVFDADVPLEAYHYNTWRQREPKEAAAWVCDLSFEARLDKPNWLIVDHHATELLPKKAQLLHHLEKSAGLLCYELCRDHELGSAELDRLIHLNNVADLFLEDDPEF